MDRIELSRARLPDAQDHRETDYNGISNRSHKSATLFCEDDPRNPAAAGRWPWLAAAVAHVSRAKELQPARLPLQMQRCRKPNLRRRITAFVAYWRPS